MLQGQQRPAPDALIGVASSSPEILRRARTVLAAAGLDPDALVFRDAREAGWSDGLHMCESVIADIVTASRIPKQCAKRIVQVLSDASVAELKRLWEFVTDTEVS